MNEDTPGRSSLVKVVTSPLGFFALSLLIVEGFLTVVLVFSHLDDPSKFYGMLIGAGLFFLVVLGVWVLVLIRPTNLTYGEQSHLEHEKMFGTERKELSQKQVEKEPQTADTTTRT